MTALADYAKTLAAQAPPLTAEQAARLRVLLEPARNALAAGGVK